MRRSAFPWRNLAALGRIVKIELTEAGRSVVDRIFDMNLYLDRATLYALSSAEKDTLDRLFTTILGRLEELSGMREPWREGDKGGAGSSMKSQAGTTRNEQ